MEDLSHEFFVSRLLSYNQFKELCNLLEVVVHYLPIRGIARLGHQDEFFVASALVCIVTYWTRPVVNHDVKLLSSHDFAKLFRYVVSQS